MAPIPAQVPWEVTVLSTMFLSDKSIQVLLGILLLTCLPIHMRKTLTLIMYRCCVICLWRGHLGNKFSPKSVMGIFPWMRLLQQISVRCEQHLAQALAKVGRLEDIPSTVHQVVTRYHQAPRSVICHPSGTNKVASRLVSRSGSYIENLLLPRDIHCVLS